MRIGLPFAVELEAGADRGPQATILLGRQADGAGGIGRVAGPFDMHHPLAAGQRDRGGLEA